MGRARGPGRGQSSPPRFSWKGRETNPTRKTERDRWQGRALRDPAGAYGTPGAQTESR